MARAARKEIFKQTLILDVDTYAELLLNQPSVTDIKES